VKVLNSSKLLHFLFSNCFIIFLQEFYDLPLKLLPFDVTLMLLMGNFKPIKNFHSYLYPYQLFQVYQSFAGFCHYIFYKQNKKLSVDCKPQMHLSYYGNLPRHLYTNFYPNAESRKCIYYHILVY